MCVQHARLTEARVHQHLVRGLPLFAAVHAPRLHHQFLPNTLVVEDTHTLGNVGIAFPAATRAQLEARGHIVEAQNIGAIVSKGGEQRRREERLTHARPGSARPSPGSTTQGRPGSGTR